MSSSPSQVTWPTRIVITLLWIGLTVAVAFLAGRWAADSGDTQDLTAPLPPIAVEDRERVSLTERSISPVVSAQGSVVHDDEGDRWLLIAPAPSADLAYRLLDPPEGVKALIDGGPVGFDCAWAGLAPAAGGVVTTASGIPAEEAMGVSMRCVIPEDVRVVAGMTGMMVLAMDDPVDALALPASAVLGSAGQGQVVVVHDDGSTETRAVQIGVADTYWVEITGGLDPDEEVLVAPTQYDLTTGSGSHD